MSSADPCVLDLGEDAVVRALVGELPPAPGSVLVGPGDDAAVLAASGAPVISTDTMVQDADFRLDWSTGHDVGVKITAQNLMDVAAMGVGPSGMLVSLVVPGSMPVSWLRDLSAGVQQACTEAGAQLIGGDLATGPLAVVTGTAIGQATDPAVRRSGAQPGDVVAVCGRIGWADAGLAWWHASDVLDVDSAGPAGPALQSVRQWHVAPHPPYGQGVVAARAGARALIDTSDGLLRDAARIASASGVTLNLDPGLLPSDGVLLDAAVGLLAAGRQPVGPSLSACADPALPVVLGSVDAAHTLARAWQLTGGEDHSLLGCFDPAAVLPESWVVIGTVTVPLAGSQPGILVAGQSWPHPLGWTHWATEPV